MKILELDENNVIDYNEFIDPDVSESIGRKFYRGIVAIEEDRIPSGAMVWEYRNMEGFQPADAEICFIRSENNDTTQTLLQGYEEKLSSMDIGKSFFELEALPKEIRDAFEGVGFTVREGEGQDLVVTVADLKPLLSLRRRIITNVSPLYEVSKLQFMQGISTCLFMGEKGIMEDLVYVEKEWFDPMSSVCALTDDMVSGMFLVHRFPSGTLMPVLLYAIGPDYKRDLLNMLRFSAGVTYDTCSMDTPVLLRRHRAPVTNLTRKIFGGRPGKQVVKGIR